MDFVHNNTVVNKCQTDTILYIPYAISIQELQDRIITRLNTKYQGSALPDDIAIPSKEWIILNFTSSNAYTTKTMQYTGSDNKHKVLIGEDIPVSTGVCNKKTLAPAEGEI
ncbi:hypothetical protein GLOIN_2v1780201 [Rhizophagus clarus]|uniref:Uncharacterized protein n=1 Tax=Rhizophagus clarus TaxID=94130 RepID=A0A8H3LTY5_9GLOM|nr:hypothetical protein GLOIN_2v1780201 [Rhizophagus clarus]